MDKIIYALTLYSTVHPTVGYNVHFSVWGSSYHWVSIYCISLSSLASGAADDGWSFRMFFETSPEERLAIWYNIGYWSTLSDHLYEIRGFNISIYPFLFLSRLMLSRFLTSRLVPSSLALAFHLIIISILLYNIYQSIRFFVSLFPFLFPVIIILIVILIPI